MATNLDHSLGNFKYHQSTCLVIRLYHIENTIYNITYVFLMSRHVCFVSEAIKEKESTKNTFQEPATESKHIESCNLCLQHT
mgnify:CR=1 FL=1|jgi:hypothetical protein